MDTELFTAFRELNNKLDNHYQIIIEKVDDLCERTTRIETKYQIDIEKGIAQTNSRFKILTALLGVFGIVVTVVNVILVRML